jgi:hypothetical protein
MKLLPDDSIFLCRNIWVCEIYKYKSNKDLINMNEKNEDLVLFNVWVHKPNIEIIASNVYVLGSKISSEQKRNKENNNNYKSSQIIKEPKSYNNHNNIHNLINDMDNSSLDSYDSKNKIFQNEKEFKINNHNILRLQKETKNHKKEGDRTIGEKIKRKDSLSVNYNESDNNESIQTKKIYYIITLDIEGNFNIYKNSENNTIIKKTLFNLYYIENISKKLKNLTFFSIGFPYYITMNEYYYAITTDNGLFVINKKKDT